ncbi:MAG: HAD family hydrolase [Sporichthyaceae bacterium]
MQLAAVLWDMDGTLIDSEPYWIECEYALVERYGGTWSHDHALAIVGLDLLVAARYIALHGDVPLAPERIVAHLLDGVIDRVQRHMPWRPGARELLAELRALEIPCAMVTMSYRRFAAAVDAALPPGSFAALVTGDEVARPKPYADPYLRAADLLGVKAAQCVAIEDSPTGVTSALAAGVRTLGVQHLVELSPAPGLYLASSLNDWTAADLAGLLES